MLDSQVRNWNYKKINFMDERGQKKKDDKAVDKEAERVLQETKIIVRWNKKPFYVS